MILKGIFWRNQGTQGDLAKSYLGLNIGLFLPLIEKETN